MGLELGLGSHPTRLGNYITQKHGQPKAFTQGEVWGNVAIFWEIVGVITNDGHLGGLLKELTRESYPSHFHCLFQSLPSHWLPGQCDPIPRLGQSPILNALFLLKFPQSVPHDLALERQPGRHCGHPPHTSSVSAISVLATSTSTYQHPHLFAQCVMDRMSQELTPAPTPLQQPSTAC